MDEVYIDIFMAILFVVCGWSASKVSKAEGLLMKIEILTSIVTGLLGILLLLLQLSPYL